MQKRQNEEATKEEDKGKEDRTKRSKISKQDNEDKTRQINIKNNNI